MHDDIWGVPYGRMLEFISGQDGAVRVNNGLFRFGSARIEIKELPERALGSLRFAQTRLIVSGGEDAEEIYRRVFIRFLSAGG